MGRDRCALLPPFSPSTLHSPSPYATMCHTLDAPHTLTSYCNTLCVALLTHTVTFSHTHPGSRTHSRPPARHWLLPCTPTHTGGTAVHHPGEERAWQSSCSDHRSGDHTHSLCPINQNPSSLHTPPSGTTRPPVHHRHSHHPQLGTGTQAHTHTRTQTHPPTRAHLAL
jgi:hypothetical protein